MNPAAVTSPAVSCLIRVTKDASTHVGLKSLVHYIRHTKKPTSTCRPRLSASFRGMCDMFTRMRLLMPVLVCTASTSYAIAAIQAVSSGITSTDISLPLAEPSTLSSDALATSPPPFRNLSASVPPPASLVNLFIGTTNGGHVFPGISYHCARRLSFDIFRTNRSDTTSWNGQSWHGHRLIRQCRSFTVAIFTIASTQFAARRI